MKFQRFSEDSVLEAIVASIEDGPCYRETACIYDNRKGGHCVVGWLLAHEAKTPEEVWRHIDATGMTANEALVESDVYADRPASQDEENLADALQHVHDALAQHHRSGRFTRAEAVTRYCQVLEQAGLHRLSEALAALPETEDR